jgi:hypothetical protein
MPLENGRADDERVSRGQASERTVCVCEVVSVEKGARRPPLPAAVVCPPGGRLAITARESVEAEESEDPEGTVRPGDQRARVYQVTRSSRNRQVQESKNQRNRSEVKGG